MARVRKASQKSETVEKKTNAGWVEWAKNPEYPEKRGDCTFCGERDDLKLSFDQIHYICKNAHACVLRWRKSRETGNP